ncbi:MAG: hypothetical protein E7773_13885 [Sphingomonas sp.]|uniref:DUF3617 domain-containing protein n=1 Tax=Sphingomonas sp. TaxID=28214 RepID=UPI001221F39D|nr:hypothetical protein [Sphingomonas sp.]THD34751.1 MAG: hypothetical protein E7773_13885 [Sphingomonas sp.]
MGTGNRYIAAALAVGLTAGVAAAAGPFGALAGLDRGRWQFGMIGGGMGRVACVPDPLRLIQFNHPGPPCAHFTIQDAPDHVTVQYNCGPRGYGKTTITVQDPGQIRLDTQGISPEGRPFDASYDGRFAGPCAPPPPPPR